MVLFRQGLKQGQGRAMLPLGIFGKRLHKVPVMTEIAPLCVLDMLWDGRGRSLTTPFFLPIFFLSVLLQSGQTLTSLSAQLDSRALSLFCASIANIHHLNTSPV